MMKSGVTIFGSGFYFGKLLGSGGRIYFIDIGLYSHKDLGFLGTYPISSL